LAKDLGRKVKIFYLFLVNSVFVALIIFFSADWSFEDNGSKSYILIQGRVAISIFAGLLSAGVIVSAYKVIQNNRRRANISE